MTGRRVGLFQCPYVPMPSSRRAFHIGDLLSVLTGIVLSPRGTLGVRALYEHMAGRPVSLEEVRLAGREYRDHLLAVYPELATFDAAEVPHIEFAREWVERRAREFTEFLEVPALPADDPLRQPPIVAEPEHEEALYYWPPHTLPWIVQPGTVSDVGRRTMLAQPGSRAVARGMSEVLMRPADGDAPLTASTGDTTAATE